MRAREHEVMFRALLDGRHRRAIGPIRGGSGNAPGPPWEWSEDQTVPQIVLPVDRRSAQATFMRSQRPASAFLR